MEGKGGSGMIQHSQVVEGRRKEGLKGLLL